MQAVILAAGRGVRMGGLTDTLPKPLLTIQGKTLLEHKIDALPPSVRSVVVVVGYRGDMIRAELGEKRGERTIRYAEQKELNGTGGALWCAKPLLDGAFLVMMGDDLYGKKDLMRLGEDASGWRVLVSREGAPHAGAVLLDAEGNVSQIREKSEGGMVNLGAFALDTRLFDHPLVPKSPGSTEMGLPQTVVAAAHASGIALVPVVAEFWIPITEPDDLPRAEAKLSVA